MSIFCPIIHGISQRDTVAIFGQKKDTSGKKSLGTVGLKTLLRH